MERGYSLYECILVLLILGVLLALALPATGRVLAGVQLQVAARRIVGDIREAQQRALTEKAIWAVRFYPEKDAYKVCSGMRVLKYVKLPWPVDLAGTNFPDYNRLTFTATGTPTQGGHVSLTVDNREWRYVIVMPVTGRVREDTVPPP